MRPFIITAFLIISLDSIAQKFYYPEIEDQSHRNLVLQRIEHTKYETIVHIKYIATSQYENGGWVCAGNTFYIRERSTNKKYKLIDTYNIPICPEKHHFKSTKDILAFRLVFERIPNDLKIFDIIEGYGQNTFKFYNVDISSRVYDKNGNKKYDELARNRNMENHENRNKNTNSTNDKKNVDSAWDPTLDKKTEWISLLNKHFGAEFTYIGTRNLEGPPQVLFLDPLSISKKGELYEAQFYQMTMEEKNAEGGGVVMTFLCDCKNAKIKMTYLGTLDGKIGAVQEEPWNQGIGDGLSGRIYNSVCNLRNQKYEYIDLIQSNGVYSIPITINGIVTREFIFDSGAADLYISQKFENLLIHLKAISKDDFIKFNSYVDANGKIEKCKVYLIKEIKIGNRIINNVECAVANSQDISFLLGQSCLEKLGKYEIDYTRNKLIIK
jgi:hypothetical protein